MEEHHRRTIRRAADLLEGDPRYPAVIVGGSVAKGYARPESDVDIMIVATPEEYARRVAAEDTLFYRPELADYPNGYVDGKFIDMSFLRDAADRGSEPTRAAFVGAYLAYSHMPELQGVLDRIPVYQLSEQQEKIEAFYTQLVVSNWYVGEAERHGNRHLLLHFASNLALFGGRLILAHNRVLYPYHKWFMHELRRVPERPAEFLEGIDALLETPSANAQAFYECVEGFRDWGLTQKQAFNRWTEQNEWLWRTSKPPVADW